MRRGWIQKAVVYNGGRYSDWLVLVEVGANIGMNHALRTAIGPDLVIAAYVAQRKGHGRDRPRQCALPPICPSKGSSG